MAKHSLNDRYYNSIPHDIRSKHLYKFIADLDFNEGNDRFCFKEGGDGDNGEHLMYLLDCYFNTVDTLD
jgi:hypothetical protein